MYSSNNKASIIVNQTSQQQIIVQIQNEGKTITTSELNKIFEPFTRGENSAHIQGSGLGLPIVKRILDYHNATISYHNPTENTNEFKVNFSI